MHIIVLVTAKDNSEARSIADRLVGQKLAACVNIIDDIQSIYQWEGKLQDDREVMLIVKSRTDLFERIAAEVKAMHSYSVPEIIALPIVAGHKDYLNWINESTQGNKK